MQCEGGNGDREGKRYVITKVCEGMKNICEHITHTQYNNTQKAMIENKSN